MNDKFLNLLGLSRKAGKLSPGHDAAFEAISSNKAAVCFVTSDASHRLKEEFMRTVTYDGRNITYVEIPYTQEDLRTALNIRAAVLTVNDKGFAKKLIELSNTKADLREDN